MGRDSNVLAAVLEYFVRISAKVFGQKANELGRGRLPIHLKSRPVIGKCGRVAQMIAGVSSRNVGHAQPRIDLEGRVTIGQDLGEAALGKTDAGAQVMDRRGGLARDEWKNP